MWRDVQFAEYVWLQEQQFARWRQVVGGIPVNEDALAAYVRAAIFDVSGYDSAFTRCVRWRRVRS